jgi:hypothetical protein
VDDFFKHSRFAVIFSGEAPAAYVVQGWDAALAKTKEGLWDGDDEPEWLAEMLAEIADEDSWQRDDYGPWHYTTEIGETCRLRVYRIHD